jgi:hypothetical protein
VLCQFHHTVHHRAGSFCSSYFDRPTLIPVS